MAAVLVMAAVVVDRGDGRVRHKRSPWAVVDLVLDEPTEFMK